MLRTQEATFTLKKRIEGLMTRVGEVIESGSSSGAPPHLLSQASTGAEAPSEPPKLQRRNTPVHAEPAVEPLLNWVGLEARQV